jgi:hypothetical protein
MERPSRAADAGIVDENVDPVEGALDAFGERFYRMQISDIAFDHGTFLGILPSAIPNGGGGLFECFA